jgi:pimeloyl-ACP methyl ester carboxylesterase
MADVLIVYVPGLTEDAGVSAPLLARIRTEEGLAAEDTWVYPRPVRLFSRGLLAGHALILSESIQQYWEDRGSPDRIIVIGHSIGGLLVRYAYLQATGSFGEEHERAWAKHVKRIVMLAAPNRGWDVNRLGRWDRWLSRFVLPLARGFAATDAIAGSAFVTGLRLQWLRQIGAQGRSAPLTVQVRSGQDALVTPEDSRDVEVLPTGVQFDLPPATHGDVPCIVGLPEDFPGQRWALLKKAILEDLDPTTPKALPEAERRFTSVVFVLHGIRAGNDGWVEQLRHQLAEHDTVRVVTGSYGRFSAYNFALPITRRRTLRWFLDQYSYLLARHPNLPFHFVGHSNGTYMLGQALKFVMPIRFERVYLAGSVLPADFNWLACVEEGQIDRLVNVCATKDKPVGWLCSGLRGLGMKDIGTGGFSGFLQLPDSAQQFRYLPGGHDAALATDQLPDVAKFALTGVSVSPQGLAAAPSGFFSLISRLAPWLARALTVTWLGLAAWLIWSSPVLLIPLIAVTLLTALALMVV